jgi:hypothetical protein
MTDLPRAIRLAAGDYFMHGQDYRMRRAGLPGNICRVVVSLEKGADVNRLRQQVAASPILDGLARARIALRLPPLAPKWRMAPGTKTIFHEHNANRDGDGPEGLPAAVLDRELHPGRGPALAFDLLHYTDGTKDLVLSWNHALMDARGAEMIWRHLGAENGGKAAPEIKDLISPAQMKRWSLSGCWQNMKQAHGSIEWLRESGIEPLFSLMPAEPRGGQTRGRQRLIAFSKLETSRIEAHCERLNAGFRRSHFYLACSLWSLHAIATARGNKEAAYLIPVPHDMRKRGANGPIFSNHLSILFYRIEPRFAGSLGGIMGELSRQMTDQIRNRFPECCMSALELFKPIPLWYYGRHLGQPTRGKFASLCFSDSGETCAGIKELAGGRIRNVTHLVPTWRPPGLTVLFWSFSGRLHVLLAWVEDCLSAAEVDNLEHGLRSALLEEKMS